MPKMPGVTGGVDLKESGQTSGHFLDRWHSDVLKPPPAPKTYVSYRDSVRKHITLKMDTSAPTG